MPESNWWKTLLGYLSEQDFRLTIERVDGNYDASLEILTNEVTEKDRELAGPMTEEEAIGAVLTCASEYASEQADLRVYNKERFERAASDSWPENYPETEDEE